MIMKDISNHKIYHLQVIYLYEANFSLMLAIHWRHTLHNTEDSKVINNGTYGDQPNKSAIAPVFIEEMMIKITRLTRSALIMFDNDTRSCYDQIDVSIMAMISRCLGAHKNVVVV